MVDEPIPPLLPNAPDIQIVEDFLPNHAQCFQELLAGICWDERMAARKTASFGKAYNYSQMHHPETPLPEQLQRMVPLLQDRLGIAFNNCLLNYYASGDNTMGFHSDDTAGFVAGTGVAIVSLGSQRDLTFRRSDDHARQVAIPLPPGSLLYMDSAVQDAWQHAIRRQANAGPRISLTWRALAS